MTEKEIQLLRFEKETYEDTDGDHHYYYYEITNGMSFISCDDVESQKGEGWWVEVFNTQEPIKFHKFEEVQKVIHILEKHLVK
jgi:hypothetical protein